MPGDGELQAALSEGQRAIAAGEWPIARQTFEAALELEETGEALFGLGITLTWLGDPQGSVRQWERAYAAFRRRGDDEQAVLAAFYLCLSYRMSLGNEAASRGWLARAASVVEEDDAVPMRGWVLLARAYLANESGDPQEGEACAREALAIARDSEDADLDLCAKSELGAALVLLGMVDEGATLLDEAMAGALAGEGGDLDTVVLISCRTVTSCDRGGDLKRATQWVHAADDFHRRYGSPHLYATCRTHYGGILFATGKWEQAETELQAALEIGKAAEPELHAEALARLAELRLAQGRFEEAVRLIAGHEHHPATARVLAAIHLARDEPGVASSVLRRRLDEIDEASLEGAALLESLVEVDLGRGASSEAAGHADRLDDLASRTHSKVVVARAERARARVHAAAGGEERSVVGHLERALAGFRRLEMKLEAGRTRFLIATLVDEERETSVAEARAALACFEELGAARDADAAAALLRSLGVKAARTGPKGIAVLTKREREVLELLGEGLSNPDIAERLFITRKTVEHHVGSVLSKLELKGRGEATAYALRNLASQRESAAK